MTVRFRAPTAMTTVLCAAMVLTVGGAHTAAAVATALPAGRVGQAWGPPQPAPSPAAAGDALAAATTEAAARTALLTVLTGAGIALSDGTGAPAATADAVIPAWQLDALAQAQVSGIAITVSQNARIFDSLSRWAGGPAISAARFSAFLSDWLASPGDDQQGYALAAIAELGRRTSPPADLAKGAAPDAALPLLILLEEQISIDAMVPDSAGRPAGLRTAGSALSEPAHPTPCGLLDKLKDANDFRETSQKVYSSMITVGEESETFWQGVNNTADELADHFLGTGSEAAAEGVTEGTIAGILSGILQDALAQGHLKVTFAQDPRPVTAQEQGDDPNNTTVTLTLAADADMPQEQADCLKLLGEKFPDMDLPAPDEPIKDAAVEVDPGGANFMDLLSFDAEDYISHGNGHYRTDSAGQVQVKLQTQPQKLPKGQGSPRTEDAMLDVTAHASDLGWGVAAMSAAIFDHVAPWTNSYPVTVRRRETRAITIKGSFNVDLLLLEVKGSLDVHSCDGFDGFLNGTLHLAGGYENGADKVVTALTGLPSTGSGDVPVAVHVQEQTKATPDDPGSPVLGAVTTLVKKIGIKFVDDHTAELVADGQPLMDVQTGQVFLFPVTEGASECPHS